jgi:DNA-binding MarR family transcriptional regulator
MVAYTTIRKIHYICSRILKFTMIDYSTELMPWIGRTAKMLDYHHSRKLKENGFDITKEQWVLLRILSHHNGVSQNEVACISNRDKTSMTRLVNTMEKKNLIARIPSGEDKRINLLYLTTQGEKLLEDTNSLVEGLMSEIKEGLTQEEIYTIISGLKKIQSNIKHTNGC